MATIHLGVLDGCVRTAHVHCNDNANNSPVIPAANLDSTYPGDSSNNISDSSDTLVNHHLPPWKSPTPPLKRPRAPSAAEEDTERAVEAAVIDCLRARLLWRSNPPEPGDCATTRNGACPSIGDYEKANESLGSNRLFSNGLAMPIPVANADWFSSCNVWLHAEQSNENCDLQDAYSNISDQVPDFVGHESDLEDEGKADTWVSSDNDTAIAASAAFDQTSSGIRMSPETTVNLTLELESVAPSNSAVEALLTMNNTKARRTLRSCRIRPFARRCDSWEGLACWRTGGGGFSADVEEVLESRKLPRMDERVFRPENISWMMNSDRLRVAGDGYIVAPVPVSPCKSALLSEA